MSFWDKLNPAGKDFLGLGNTAGRVLGDIFTGGFGELGRPDPFGAKRKTGFAKTIGGLVTGGIAGFGTGLLVGGPYGAIVGGVLGATGGGIAGATGTTKNYTIGGVASNIGIGVGAGGIGGAASALSTASTTATLGLPAVKAPAVTSLFKGLGITAIAKSLLDRAIPAIPAALAPPIQAAPAEQGAPPAPPILIPAGGSPAPVPGATIMLPPGQSQLGLIVLALALVLAAYFFTRRRHHG